MRGFPFTWRIEIRLLTFSTDKSDFRILGESRKPTPPTVALMEFLVAEDVMSWYESMVSILRESEWCCLCYCKQMISLWCMKADDANSCFRDNGLSVLVLRVLNWNIFFLLMKWVFAPVLLQVSGPTLPEGFKVAPSYTELAVTGWFLGALTLVLFSCIIIVGILSDG